MRFCLWKSETNKPKRWGSPWRQTDFVIDRLKRSRRWRRRPDDVRMLRNRSAKWQMANKWYPLVQPIVSAPPSSSSAIKAFFGPSNFAFFQQNSTWRPFKVSSISDGLPMLTTRITLPEAASGPDCRRGACARGPTADAPATGVRPVVPVSSSSRSLCAGRPPLLSLDDALNIFLKNYLHFVHSISS